MTKLPPLAPFLSVQSETRIIIEDWRRLVARLHETVLFAESPPRWPAPKGSDVFLALEFQKANRLIENGRSVDSAVEWLAFALVARMHGTEQTDRALRVEALSTVQKAHTVAVAVSTIGPGPEAVRTEAARAARRAWRLNEPASKAPAPAASKAPAPAASKAPVTARWRKRPDWVAANTAPVGAE